MTRNTDDLFIELCEVARRAFSGDMEAAGELRRIGELLALTGGLIGKLLINHKRWAYFTNKSINQRIPYK